MECCHKHASHSLTLFFLLSCFVYSFFQFFCVKFFLLFVCLLLFFAECVYFYFFLFCSILSHWRKGLQIWPKCKHNVNHKYETHTSWTPLPCHHRLHQHHQPCHIGRHKRTGTSKRNNSPHHTHAHTLMQVQTFTYTHSHTIGKALPKKSNNECTKCQCGERASERTNKFTYFQFLLAYQQHVTSRSRSTCTHDPVDSFNSYWSNLRTDGIWLSLDMRHSDVLEFLG